MTSIEHPATTIEARSSRTSVLTGTRELGWETREVPAPGPHEVRVRVRRIGVCGSDVHYYTHGRIGSFVVEAPLVLGHEVMGVVEALGENVTRLSVGDRVALEPGYPCRRCTYCKRGEYNLCPEMTFMATPPVDGALAEYVIWPDDFAFPLPDSISDDAGALLEPLAVGVWAARKGAVTPGDSVAVFGAGPIGCTTIQAAKAAGATTIIAVDLEDFRLDLARKVGATHSLNARHQDVLAVIRELTRRDLPPSHAGVDVAFETAGSLPTTRMTLAAPRPGGRAVLVGLPPDPEVSLDIVSAASREVTLRGVFRYANCYPAAIDLVASGAVDLDLLITHRYAFDQTPEAFAFADLEKKTSMKVMIEVG
ncbi:NAD(P)-dependent alcohol dehydrogenase [Deinococcus humi]|uniref:L-iditol 2-dehydrogenase n=1 Tax=Deinococcus humi TaxID=662880 RepID=A0A7W8JW43_9DEIO|nr:NAD(P)-dependent alcohol dehydrogenase [Deinococcus humi]MBB5363018.1 L-iditol 2-dehydrogenase [Deinococcus humi]GGO25120.1 sorbitol dehydrogenase [Deinococcus humi]